MDAQIPPNMANMAQEAPEQAVDQLPPEEAQAIDDLDESGFLDEVKRGLDGIKAALYKDKAVSDQFLNVLDPQKKVDSLVRASVLLVTELDKKMDLDEEILAPMVVMAAGELMELAEAGNGMTFSEEEQKQAVMAAFEAVLQAYDIDQQAAADFVGQVGPEAEKQGVADYEAAMKGAGAQQP